jgi:tripartite-type tricarboxylate transporter receptor subunit TctC
MPRSLARFLLLAICLTGFLTANSLAQVENKPLRIIAPFAAGGPTDVATRVIAQKLAEALTRPVIVENHPGGATMIATQLVANAAPDGNTILLTAPDFVINAFIQPKLFYHPLKDFAPITVVAKYHLVMTANAQFAPKTVQELIAYAKANPGVVNYASAGVGSTAHLSGELLQMLAGVKLNHVPYKGLGPSMTDLIAGRVQLTFINWILVEQEVKQGRLRPIAVTGLKRMALIPETPTIAESGVPGFEIEPWIGFIAPKGTTTEIVNRLQQGFATAMGSPELQKRLANLGAVLGASTPQEFSDYLVTEYDKWGKVARTANVKAE